MLALAGEQAGKPVPMHLSWLYTTGALALFFLSLIHISEPTRPY